MDTYFNYDLKKHEVLYLEFDEVNWRAIFKLTSDKLVWSLHSWMPTSVLLLQELLFPLLDQVSVLRFEVWTCISMWRASK